MLNLYGLNLDDSLGLYGRQMSMQLEFELSRPGLRIAMLESGSARLELLEMMPSVHDQRRTAGLRHIAFQVADLNRAYAASATRQQGS